MIWFTRALRANGKKPPRLMPAVMDLRYRQRISASASNEKRTEYLEKLQYIKSTKSESKNFYILWHRPFQIIYPKVKNAYVVGEF
jgi:hypothetical protein